jgi:hypothetical protein
MRSILLLAFGLLATLPLLADPAASAPTGVFTLFSVSHPGFVVTEAQGLCNLVSGGATPLRLRLSPGNANDKLVSLEAVDFPGYFLRHQNCRIKLHPYAENDGLYANDSTFHLIHNPDGTVSFQSYNCPNLYLTVTAKNELWATPDPEAPSRSFTLGY